MARMIPPVVHSGCASPGEREIFRRLRDDPATADWIVLHSLDVAEHRKQVSGEIDFVVIVPSKGVLCLEVKACRDLHRDGGLWYYGSDPNPDARGPFKQASDAMHSVRKRLVERRPDLSRVVFWSVAVFPYVPFSAVSPEWHPWQVIDSRAMRSRPLGALLEGVLDSARSFLREGARALWFEPSSASPDAHQCAAIAAALRPDFEFYESPKSQAARRDEEVKQYTAEQFAALDAMESNPRVVFNGPAGTGKTLLAIETARRSRAAGRRVLLVCFNRLLARWLQDQTASLAPNVTCTGLHQHMLRVAGFHQDLGERDSGFWQTELPQMAGERLLAQEDDESRFDELIVDEAQDVLRETYLDFLDLSLKGGLSSGRWRMFGDFDRQAIYSSPADVTLGGLRARAGEPPLFSLRVNCRNTPRIATYAHLLGGLVPEYTRVLRPDDRIDPELLYYRDAADQQQLLVRTLEGLYREGFSGGDIAVLSAKAGTAACAAGVRVTPWSDRLRPYENASRGQIRHCSIHAFKGIEAPAAVITDVEHIDGSTSTDLFYVAVTRALHRLVILAHDTVKRDVVAALMKLRDTQP